MIESMRFIANLPASWIQQPLLKDSFTTLFCLAKIGHYGSPCFEMLSAKSHHVRKPRANSFSADYSEVGRNAMLHVLETLLRKLDRCRYRRNIDRALALHLRGEVRRDGLNPTSLTTHLEIEWRARDIHPWDRGLLSRAQRAAAFVEQSLADTEAAIYRLFEALPPVDAITLRVFDPTSDNVIISGTVLRAGMVARDEDLSIGMRLRYLGLTYHSAGFLFETLKEDHGSAPLEGASAPPAFPTTEESIVKAMCRRDLNAP
jgi:hypothetical protein